MSVNLVLDFRETELSVYLGSGLLNLILTRKVFTYTNSEPLIS